MYLSARPLTEYSRHDLFHVESFVLGVVAAENEEDGVRTGTDRRHTLRQASHVLIVRCSIFKDEERLERARSELSE